MSIPRTAGSAQCPSNQKLARSITWELCLKRGFIQDGPESWTFNFCFCFIPESSSFAKMFLSLLPLLTLPTFVLSSIQIVLRSNSTLSPLPLSSALANPSQVPGSTWTAAGTHQHVQAHGGSITLYNGIYYLIGENHLSGSAFQSINCYSSPDLVSWTFQNELLSVQSSGDLGPNRVVERPKVLLNEGTGKWVLWMHIDDSSYGEARAGVATSTTICGNYNYL